MNALRAVGDFDDSHLAVLDVFRARTSAGERVETLALPTTTIAKDLDVSPISIAALLRSMERHGWLTSARAAWKLTPLGLTAAAKRAAQPRLKPEIQTGDDAA